MFYFQLSCAKKWPALCPTSVNFLVVASFLASAVFRNFCYIVSGDMLLVATCKETKFACKINPRFSFYIVF